MKKLFMDSVQFIKGVSTDPRIPERDKAILVALLGLLVSPFDIIPDFIPFFGQMDDIVIVAIILDYLFEKLDQEVILSHFPWSLSKFLFMKKMSKFLTWMVPGFLKDRLWKYSGSPYVSGK